MILRQLQKKLDSNWIKENKIWDILIYGSYSRGKLDAKEIDIAVILSEAISTKKKMEICQELRKKLSKEGCILDIKALDINDFLNVGFLGRESVFAEGYSILKKDYIAERFGYEAVTFFKYTFKNLNKSKQKIFYYALQGRKPGTGVLARIKGSIISKGMLMIPTRYYEEVKDLMDLYKIDYKVIFTLRYRILH